jgi:hypothetical protein
MSLTQVLSVLGYFICGLFQSRIFAVGISILREFPPFARATRPRFRRLPFSEPVLHGSLAAWHTVELPRNRTIDNFRGDRLLGSIHADVIQTGKYLFLHLPPETMDESGPSNFPPIYQHVFRRLERILYVFATRSPCGSLQGFNEIAAILFRVCTNHF